MSFALPARQITFGRTNNQQQPYQYQQQGLALPGGGAFQQPQPANSLSLPGPSPLSNSFVQPQGLKAPSPPNGSLAPPAAPAVANNAVAGPSTPPASQTPSTPAALTLEQQHITAVEGIVPTLQNIVATVNLDCRLDLKTIALHARNAEYNPKVGKYVII